MQIYVSRNGQQIGVWSEEEFRQLAVQGQLVATDLYWHEGLTEWASMADRFAPAAPLPARAVESKDFQPDKEEPPASRAGWILPLFLAVALSAILGPSAPSAHPSEAEDLGAVTGGAIFLAGLAFLVSLPFKRSWRFGIRCVVIAVLFGLCLLGKRETAMKNIQSETEKFAEEQKAAERAQIQKGGYAVYDSAKVDAEIAKIRTLAQNENSPNRKMTETGMQVVSMISAHIKACQLAEKPVVTLGLDPEKLSSLGELEARRAALIHAKTSVDDMVGFLQNLDGTVTSLLSSEGFGEPDISQFIAGFHQSSHLPEATTYWQMENQVLQKYSERLDLLKATWGRWHMDNGQLIFDAPDALARYQDNTGQIVALVQKQHAIQQALLAPSSATDSNGTRGR